jgi:hypothetical protein
MDSGTLMHFGLASAPESNKRRFQFWRADKVIE